jgi:hypothetical protein
MMLRAVTNRDFPKLKQLLKTLFDIELDYDRSIKFGKESPATLPALLKMAWLSRDAQDRIRIIFINTEDLSFGMSKKADVTGRSIPHKKLAFIGVPETIGAVSDNCIKPDTIDGYLLAITFHELYEVITGDFGHCEHPRRCINSLCDLKEVGTCSACMGGFIDKKYPDLTLEDLYCEEHLAKLNLALARIKNS